MPRDPEDQQLLHGKAQSLMTNYHFISIQHQNYVNCGRHGSVEEWNAKEAPFYEGFHASSRELAFS